MKSPKPWFRMFWGPKSGGSGAASFKWSKILVHPTWRWWVVSQQMNGEDHSDLGNPIDFPRFFHRRLGPFPRKEDVKAMEGDMWSKLVTADEANDLIVVNFEFNGALGGDFFSFVFFFFIFSSWKQENIPVDAGHGFSLHFFPAFSSWKRENFPARCECQGPTPLWHAPGWIDAAPRLLGAACRGGSWGDLGGAQADGLPEESLGPLWMAGTVERSRCRGPRFWVMRLWERERYIYIYNYNIYICDLIICANLRMSADFHTQASGVCMEVVTKVVGIVGCARKGKWISWKVLEIFEKEAAVATFNKMSIQAKSPTDSRIEVVSQWFFFEKHLFLKNSCIPEAGWPNLWWCRGSGPTLCCDNCCAQTAQGFLPRTWEKKPEALYLCNYV